MKHLFALRYSIALCSLLFFAGMASLFHLEYPTEFVFDERYHVPAIKLISEHDVRAFEWWHPPLLGEDNHDWLHPPLAKYIQTIFYTWGNGSVVSWRIGSVYFGLFGIFLTYVLASVVTKDRVIGLLSAFFLSMSSIWLVQSRVAMNDIFLAVWFLLGALCYVFYRETKKDSWLLMTGLALGAAIATKWSGIFFVVGLGTLEFFRALFFKSWKTFPWKFFCIIALPLFLYFLSYAPLLFQGKNVSFLWHLHKNILWYQTHRDSLHPSQSVPAEWITSLKPIWYWHGAEGANIYLMENPLLFIAELLALCATVFMVWKKRVRELSLLLFFYSWSFVPWVLSPRIVFLYHYTVALPFLAIMVGFWTKKVYLESSLFFLRVLFGISVILLVAVFWIYYPFFVGFPVSKELQQTVYFLLQN